MTAISLGTSRRKVSRPGPGGVEVPFQEVAIDDGAGAIYPVSYTHLARAPARAIALSTDGNSRWCALDPRAGTRLVVAESALNAVSYTHLFFRNAGAAIEMRK